MSTKARGLTRLFSSFTKLSKSNKNTSIANSQIQKALDLLKESKFNFETITEEEKVKYVNDFTNILSTGLQKSNETENVKHHFDQSLLGLNQILTKSTQSSFLDPISIKELVTKAHNESELLKIYDDLVNNGIINLSNFKLILFNKHLRDLNHIITKLNFINHDGKFDSLKILITTKAYILKNSTFANKIYSENIDKWLYLRSESKLPTFLEKSLYQIIFKHERSTDLFTKELNFTLPSYILLVESIPKKTIELKSIQDDADFKLSKNQDLLIRFLTFIINKTSVTQPNITNTFIRKLIKLSVENHIHNEEYSKDSELTIQKYRFINSINELSEDMVTEYGNDSELTSLIESIHETDDLLQNETVLKFI